MEVINYAVQLSHFGEEVKSMVRSAQAAACVWLRELLAGHGSCP